MIYKILTLFPEMFKALNAGGVIARALTDGIVALNTINPREFAAGKYKRIDDKTFGGGPGMVMMLEPLEKALKVAKDQLISLNHINNAKVIYLSPQGRSITQSLINELAHEKGLIFVCGRYEGVDERFIKRNVDLEVSIGDFIVSGGELPTMLLIDAIVRLLPGVLNSSESAMHDSFMQGLLDYPHYTIPQDYAGELVPEVLLSGNHELIRKWRLQQSLWRTYLRRPDLLETYNFTQEERILLDEMLNNELNNN